MGHLPNQRREAPRHADTPRRGRCWATFGALVVASACVPPQLPEPVVTSVDPQRVWNGADIPVEITGANFLPQIDVDAGGYGTDLDNQWQVDLVGPSGGGSLAGVTVEDARHLLGVVPAGLVAGDYWLELTGPGGQFVASDEALLEVSDNQEVGLQVAYYDDPTTYSAGERVRLLFEAVGFDSERVVTDVPVQVTLTGASVELVHTEGFEAVDSLPLNEGVGFVGVLPDGQAILPVELLAPGRLDVVARSAGGPTLQQGTLTLFVEGGSKLPAEIRLPGDAFEAQAGVPFSVMVTLYEIDGVTVLEEPVEIELTNACGTFSERYLVQGPTAVEVEVTKVTQGTNCAEDAITVSDGAVGSSEGFEVVGGPPNQLRVFAVPGEARAGAPLALFIVAQDGEGNVTPFDGSSVTVSDDLDSLQVTACDAAEQAVSCTVVGTVASDDIQVTVDAGGGLEGTYDGLVITAGEETGELVVAHPSDVRAGEPAEVGVQPLDLYGNPQDPSEVGADEVVLTDELGDVVCVPTDIDALAGVQHFDCTFTVARDDAVVSATGLGAVGTTSAFDIDNGVVGEVTLGVPAAVEAGDSFSLLVQAFDAFGNPYLRQDDPVIDLGDALDGLTVASVTLDAGGTATTSAALIRAGTTTIEAGQGGVVLGVSSPIDVSSGPTDGLAVSVAEPWAYVGTSVPLTVQSVDEFGNRTSVTGTVTVSSQQTSTPDLQLGMVNGLAASSYTWDEQALNEVLDAITDGGVEGSSVELYVVRTCGDGPAAGLDFGGFPEAVVCYDDLAKTATVSASMGTTTQGADPIFGYAVAAEGSPAVIDSQADLDVVLDAVGATRIRALAVADNGCADETSGIAYVGLDDGSVTGPVQLVTSASELDPIDTIIVDVVGATDCARDLAADAELWVRTTAGTLVGPSASGTGPSVTLDAFGDATFDLVTDGELSSGDVEVHAWVSDGSALGLLTLPLDGDEIRPTVLSLDPSGEVLDVIDEAVVRFSEPLLGSSVLPSRFELDGPGAAAVDTVSLSPEGDEVTVTFDVPADGAAGAWTLTVSREIRDQSGQRLAGTWGDVAVDFVGTFGDVGGGVDPVSCLAVTPAGQRFAPDGDDGLDAEADAIEVTIDSAFTPAWWVVTVTDQADAVVYQDWEVPLAPIDSLTWDGRNLAGLVVPNGTYQLEIAPEDGVGNRGAGCVVQAVVANGLGVLPGVSEDP